MFLRKGKVIPSPYHVASKARNGNERNQTRQLRHLFGINVLSTIGRVQLNKGNARYGPSHWGCFISLQGYFAPLVPARLYSLASRQRDKTTHHPPEADGGIDDALVVEWHPEGRTNLFNSCQGKYDGRDRRRSCNYSPRATRRPPIIL